MKDDNRINQLEDERFEKMSSQIDKIYKILIGNGSKGLVQEVTEHKMEIRLLLFLFSTVSACVITCLIKKYI